MTGTHSSSLSPQQVLVLRAVRKHTQLTSSQVRRLLYVRTSEGRERTPKGQENVSRRHLKRLYDLGLIRRVWSVYDDRPAEYLYMPAGTTTRGAVQHTLDISELFVRLVEASTEPRNVISDYKVAFDREPWCHIDVGRITLKPDAYLEIGGSRKAFLEVDRGPERKPQLVQKLNRYVKAFYEWDADKDSDFPQVIWTVPDADRQRTLWQLVRRTSVPELFHVSLFGEVVNEILGL